MSRRSCGSATALAVGILLHVLLAGSIFAQGDVVNVVQWPASEGGNDHWYGVYAQQLSYAQCDSAAQANTQDGHAGYLATITSQAENTFVVEHVFPGLGTVPNNRLFLGAVISCGEFSWATGEPVTFINWQPSDYSRISGSILMLTDSDPSIVGTWRDASGITAYALVEFGDPASTAPGDELINLVQWPVAEGGNDHWYAVIGKTMPWAHHVDYAKTLVHDTTHGYLATILSQPENQFIVDHVIAGVNPNCVTDEFYIGGQRQYPANVNWLTGEAAAYVNWAGGEPSGDGTGLGMWGAVSGHTAGTWNDVPSDTVGRACYHMLWSVVEWGPAEADTTTPPTGLTNLVQWPAASGGNDHWYGVLAVPQSYNQSKAAAAAITQRGDTGYLASITSVEENDFVVQQVLNGLGSVPGDQLFMGASVSCGIMRWETGEPVSFINWQPSDISRISGVVLMRAGADPSVAGKWHNMSMSTSFALVEFGSATAAPEEDLLNLVQWPASEGGNDHWYAVIGRTMPWAHHVDYAKTLVHDTAHGYLATILSAQENQFVVNQVIAGITPNAVVDEFYIGGQRDYTNGFHWLTGETGYYSNWAGGEPNGDGIGMGIWGATSGRDPGTWNDVPTDTVGIDCFHMLWSVVEWGPSDTGIAPSTELTHLVQWPVAEGGNDHWYGILPDNQLWQNQNLRAQALTYEGQSGYLATITTAEENQFVLASVLGTLPLDSLAVAYAIGGKRDCSGFEWTTGEAFGYANWYAPGQKPTQAGVFFFSQQPSSITPGTWEAADMNVHTSRPALVEFGPLDTRSLDTVVNLKQWTAAQGGNDHWYAVINAARPWVSQYEIAHQLTHDGTAGYLATITSAEENQFVVDSIMGDVYPNAIIDEYYLGGRRPMKDSAFQWLTGEAIDYGNWAFGEPSGDGPAMAIWGKTSGRTLGSWNDVPEDTLGIDCYHQIYAIVEWGGMDPSAHQIVLGNVDCDPTNRVDISDLTKLIDFAYINRSRWNFLWCPEAANIDTDPDHQIDIADITRMIDYLYISFEPLGSYK